VYCSGEVTSYRDDRESLRQRVSELEEELARIRDANEHDELRKELTSLSERVAAATTKLDEERDGLSDLAARIDGLRRKTTNEPPVAPPRRFVAVGLIAVACAIALLVVYFAGRTQTEPAIAPAIPGAPHAVDAMALLAEARRLAGSNKELVSIQAMYVKSDGTLDLEGPGYAGSVVYTFVDRSPPDPPPDPSLPLGAPRPSKPPPTQTRVILNRSGFQVDHAFFGPGQSIPEPHCSIRDVWGAAIAAGAPSEAVAIITYRHDTSLAMTAEGKLDQRKGPVWQFRIEGTTHDHDIDPANCRIIPQRRAD
jgi:hypothetical protein